MVGERETVEVAARTSAAIISRMISTVTSCTIIPLPSLAYSPRSVLDSSTAIRGNNRSQSTADQIAAATHADSHQTSLVYQTYSCLELIYRVVAIGCCELNNVPHKRPGETALVERVGMNLIHYG